MCPCKRLHLKAGHCFISEKNIALELAIVPVSSSYASGSVSLAFFFSYLAMKKLQHERC